MMVDDFYLSGLKRVPGDLDGVSFIFLFCFDGLGLW